jgi:hypothetical protein
MNEWRVLRLRLEPTTSNTENIVKMFTAEIMSAPKATLNLVYIITTQNGGAKMLLSIAKLK